MAITLTREPGAAVFSRNPVVFGFHTDRRYANEGRPFVGHLVFSSPRTDGVVMRLEYGGTTLFFVFVDVIDGSGLRLPAWDGVETMAEWRDKVLAALSRNYYLNRDFELTAVSDNTIALSARVNSDAYDVTLLDGVGITMGWQQSGVPALFTANLKVLAELYVMGLDGGYELFVQAVLEPDDNGHVVWDVSEALTTALLADGHDRPNLSLPVFETSGRTVRRFFVRYAEMLGQPQRVGIITDTAVKWGVYGGFSKGMLAERSFPGWFVSAGKLKWMDQSGGYRVVKPDQPDYLYAVNFSGGQLVDLDVRVKVLFSDNTDVTYTADTFAAVPEFMRVMIPAGMKQLGVHLQDAEKVPATYEVWLEDAGGVRTEVMRFTINYRYEPYTRFFVYENSFGGYEGVYVYGRKSKGYEVVQQRATLTRMADFVLTDGDSIDFDVRLTDSEEVNTGYMTRRQLRGFRDFFLSTEKFAYKNGRFYPITLVSKNINEFQDGNNLFALAFEVGSRYSEELFTADEETDEYAYTPDLSGYIPPPPSDPENFDDRYYLKTETYNRAEIDAKVAAVQNALVAYAAATNADLAAKQIAINGKAPLNHTHDQYVTEGFVYEQLDTTWTFRGDWVLPEPDEEDSEVYSAGIFVVHNGVLWKSTAEDNVSEPGEAGADWERVLDGAVYRRDDTLGYGAVFTELSAAFANARIGDVLYSESSYQRWEKVAADEWMQSGFDKIVR
ncbi:MAG TPA: hypothetical protein VNQ80_15475 [Parapedobacter sp.]|uniref:hypothetical protein n=1 Tax=Parapedobacter sp. TaxID=1958893 RepID=UPI002BBEBABF|nr:hypothetical protein [Parapedobacter sp.]HWK58743.1 hypothetical protein [Parapedobacter sp.]